MIDSSIKLTTLVDTGSIADYSDEMADYLNDPLALLIDTITKVYIGFKKPFNAVYFDMRTPNTEVSTILVEYYNGSTWVPAVFTDDSKGFSRSGLVSWDKSNMSMFSVDSKDRYYIRITVSADTSAMVFNGGNIVFSDDRDMQQEFFEITNQAFLPAGFSSQIHAHVAARNQIIQELRNRGNQSTNSSTGHTEDLTAFDLHDIFQVREAAMFLALAKVFFRLSDNMEDQWFMRFTEYTNKYKAALSLYTLDLDSNGNGIEEDNKQYRVFRFSR